jgi:predicted MFS family arabinose efflux permease
MSNPWAVLALLCLARVSMGLHLQSVAAIAPFMIADLGFSYAEVGLLVGLFMLPGTVLALPGGLVSGRIGDRATVLGGLVLVAGGAGLLALTQTLALAVVARLLSGAGAVLLNMQVAKLVTTWFVGRRLATAMGIMLAMFPLGIALSLALLSSLAAATGWRAAAMAAAAWTCLPLVLVALLYRDPPRQAPAGEPERPSYWVISPHEQRLMLVGGLAYALLNGAFLVFFSFAPTLLIGRGRSEVEASTLVSWASWLTIVCLPLSGYLLDRAGRAAIWLFLASVAPAAVTLVLPLAEPVAPWIVLFGIAAAPAIVGILTLPGEVLRPESRATGFGIFYTLMYLGFALLPPLAGYLLDTTGNPAAPLWFSSLLWLAVLAPLVAFGRLRRRALPIGSEA